jgi:hypothetical protein
LSKPGNGKAGYYKQDKKKAAAQQSTASPVEIVHVDGMESLENGKQIFSWFY